MNKTKYLDELRGIYLYILELQKCKYYVGITHNISERIDKHINAQTTDFVKQNLPIKNMTITLLETRDRKQALIIEDRKTIELIAKYGIENVYGGKISGNIARRKKWYFKVVNNKICI
ncbi:MAG: GIY-YIG nuclease family protein [Chlorobi bacterium]|nr:GIY-YIG nuclease family protein [Chlorobiota bacterium]